MNYGELLKKQIEKSGKTMPQIAEQSGISRATLYNLMEEEAIKEKYLDKLKKAGIYLDENGRTANKNMIVVPLKAVGGFLAGYENKVYLDSLERREFPEIRGECFCFEVDGHSMYESIVKNGRLYETGYKPGSNVVATKVENVTWLSKNKDYVFQTTDGLIVKTFDKIKDDKFHLLSINEDYNPVPPIPLKAVKGIYFIEKKIS